MVVTITLELPDNVDIGWVPEGDLSKFRLLNQGEVIVSSGAKVLITKTSTMADQEREVNRGSCFG